MFVSWSDSDEQLVPFVMLTGRRGTATRKGLIEQLNIRDQMFLHPSPGRKCVAAGAADLIGKELDGAL